MGLVSILCVIRWPKGVILGMLAAMVMLGAVFAVGRGPAAIDTGRAAVIVLGELSGWTRLQACYDEREAAVVMHIRLPRVALSVLVGAALAAGGAAMQGLFRNPLADPGLIGVSGGGAMGAAFAIVFGGVWMGALPESSDGAGAELDGFTDGGQGVNAGEIAESFLATEGAFVTEPPVWVADYAAPLCAMICGVGVTFLIYRLARIGGRLDVPTMLLAGIAVNAMTGAFIGLMIFFADTSQIRDIAFWMMGSLSGANWRTVGAAAVFVLLPMMFLLSMARDLNAFLLGEAEAAHLGVPTARVKRRLIAGAAAMVGASVAVSGIIGFVGLIVPHLVRLILGPDHRWVLPGSAFLGAFLLMMADLAARTATESAELPIGALTSLVGGPVFLTLLLTTRRHG